MTRDLAIWCSRANLHGFGGGVFEHGPAPRMRAMVSTPVRLGTPEAESISREAAKVSVVMQQDGRERKAKAGRIHADRSTAPAAMKWTFYDERSNVQLIELAFGRKSEGRDHGADAQQRISPERRRSQGDKGWNACLDELAESWPADHCAMRVSRPLVPGLAKLVMPTPITSGGFIEIGPL